MREAFGRRRTCSRGLLVLWGPLLTLTLAGCNYYSGGYPDAVNSPMSVQCARMGGAAAGHRIEPSWDHSCWNGGSDTLGGSGINAVYLRSR